jgi:hypothetical protein
MQRDARERALGVTVTAGTVATVLVASPGLVSINTGSALDKYAEPLILVNSHPAGPAGDGAEIQGFIFRSGNDSAGAVVGGNAVWAMRAQHLIIRDNQIEGGFAEPIEMRSSTGHVARNLLKGAGQSCAICAFGPGDYQIYGNRQTGLANRLAVLVFPTMSAAVPPGVEPLVLPDTAWVKVNVVNNEFRNHQEVPFGIGVRVAAVGISAPNVFGTAQVRIEDNDLSDNRFAVVAEAGFPVANTGLRGNIVLELQNNVLGGSCQAPLLISMTGQGTAAGLANGIPVRNSTFAISLGDNLLWSDVWYSHPAGAGNTLTVDQESIVNGFRVPYDKLKSCPVG